MTIKRQAIFWSCLFLSIVGFTLHIHQLFAMAATLACLPLISRLLSRRKLEGIVVRRDAPEAVTCGEPIRVNLTLRNEARTRRIFFTARESLPAALWQHEQQEFPVAILGPGEQTTAHYELPSTRRGAWTLGPVTLTTGDVIGLQQYHRELSGVNEVLVYPQAVALPQLWPASPGSRQPVRPRRRLRGVGDEFYGVRDYVPGDDPRQISWKTSARRGHLMVIEHEQPESLSGLVLVDTEARWHAGADERHTLEYAVPLAATLMEQAYERGSEVGLIAGAQHAFPPLPESDQRLRLYEALARVKPDGDTPLAELLATHHELLPQHTAVAVISPSPEAGEVAAWLRGMGHAVVWFVLDASSFGAAADRDYSQLLTQLAEAQCATRVISGDRLLEANWERGMSFRGGAARVAVR